MSFDLKSPNRKVVSTRKIDGAAYRVVALPDGSAMVEEWKSGRWVRGGATFGEIADSPPVSAEFAARLGIPIEDLKESTDRSDATGKPHLVMIDPPGPFSTLDEWEHFLAEVEGWPPDTLGRQDFVARAERMIASKRQEVEDLSEAPAMDAALLSADRNKRNAGFKPDYGLRLLKDGCSPATDLFFNEFRLFSISILGNGIFSTMVEQRYDGEIHALSLDFNHAQLEQVLVRAESAGTPTASAKVSTRWNQ